MVSGSKVNYTEILELMEKIGIPYSYDHFAENESPDPPFCVFLFPSSSNFSADGKVYQKIDVFHIELYTDKKDPDMELTVENVLDSYDFFYNKSEVKLYEVLYSMEVIWTNITDQETTEQTNHTAP